MKRNVKTLLMGTVALMAGVGLASAQGMRDVPGRGRPRCLVRFIRSDEARCFGLASAR